MIKLKLSFEEITFSSACCNLKRDGILFSKKFQQFQPVLSGRRCRRCRRLPGSVIQRFCLLASFALFFLLQHPGNGRKSIVGRFVFFAFVVRHRNFGFSQLSHRGHGRGPHSHVDDVVGDALLAHAHVAAQPGKDLFHIFSPRLMLLILG